MAVAITNIRQTGGAVHIEWSDGGHFEIPGGSNEVKTAVKARLDTAADNEFLKWLLLAAFLFRFPNPTQGQINGFEGTSIALSLASNAPVTITPA